MIPVAELAELEEKERMVEAIAVLFSKDSGKSSIERAAALRRRVRQLAFQARDLSDEQASEANVEDSVRALDRAFGNPINRSVGRGQR